jgi:hypothetical protein
MADASDPSAQIAVEVGKAAASGVQSVIDLMVKNADNAEYQWYVNRAPFHVTVECATLLLWDQNLGFGDLFFLVCFFLPWSLCSCRWCCDALTGLCAGSGASASLPSIVF